MSVTRFTGLLLLVAAPLTTTASAPAIAADTALSATTDDVLAVEVSQPPNELSGLGPGRTAAGGARLTVTATRPWTLSVRASDPETPGTMDVAGGNCEGIDRSLSEPLVVLAEPASGVSFGRRALGGEAVSLAAGDLSTDVAVTFEQVIPRDQQMRSGCRYSITLTYSVIAR